MIWLSLLFALLFPIKKLLPLLKCGATYLLQVCSAVDDLEWLPARDLIHQILGLVADLEVRGPMKGHNLISTNAMQISLSYVKTSAEVQTLKGNHPTGNNKYPADQVNKVVLQFPSHVVRGAIVHKTPPIPGKKKPDIPFSQLTKDVQELIKEAEGKPTEELVSHSINDSC